MNKTSILSHKDYQDAVDKLLTYYGYNAKLEYWTLTNNKPVRLDVYGTCARKEICNNTTVAIEVSRTSRLEKDLDRVYTVKASYGFVLAVKQGFEVPAVGSGNVFVVRNLEELENKLRELLKVPNDYPMTTADLLARVPKYQDLDEAFDKFGVPVEIRERARRLLLHAHTTCYKLYKDYEDLYYMRINGKGYYAVGDEVAYNILHQLGLVDITRDRGTGYNVVITNENVTSVEAENYVSKVEEELRKLIEMHGWEVALMTYAERFKVNNDEPLFPSRIEYCNKSGYDCPYSWPPDLKRALVSVSALYPVLKERYQEFWEGLAKLGLAFECEGVRLLPEASEIIFELVINKLTDFIKNEEIVKDLASLNVLYHFFPLTPDKLERFYDMLKILGLSLNDLEKASQNLHTKGVISGFNKDAPPHMLIFDETKFKKEIVNDIKQLYIIK